jgi:hypothetical protein
VRSVRPTICGPDRTTRYCRAVKCHPALGGWRKWAVSVADRSCRCPHRVGRGRRGAIQRTGRPSIGARRQGVTWPAVPGRRSLDRRSSICPWRRRRTALARSTLSRDRASAHRRHRPVTTRSSQARRSTPDRRGHPRPPRRVVCRRPGAVGARGRALGGQLDLASGTVDRARTGRGAAPPRGVLPSHNRQADIEDTSSRDPLSKTLSSAAGRRQLAGANRAARRRPTRSAKAALSPARTAPADGTRSYAVRSVVSRCSRRPVGRFRRV